MTLLDEKCVATEEAAKQSALPLTARVVPGVSAVLDNRRLLTELTGALGSPLNVLLPELVTANVQGFKDAFKKLQLQGRVFFAHKCNRSDSVVRQLALSSDACIDVSSVNELGHALASGFEGKRIEATGPKTPEFLFVCIQHGVTVSIDSIEELKLLLTLRKSLPQAPSTPILLRLCGFRSSHTRFLNKGSRFGISIDKVGEAFDILTESGEQLRFLGFSFHLDTVSVPERMIAIENCVQLFEEAVARGFEPSVLNIGGGYKVNYLADENEWNAYTSALKEGVLGQRPTLAWQGNTFGMYVEQGKLRGNFNSYNYFDGTTGPAFLVDMLRQPLPDNPDVTAAEFLRDNMIALWIEPGRALLDQVGLTVAEVLSVRDSSNGDTLVSLRMKRQDISFLDQEIFVDPVIIYQQEPAGAADEPVAVYFSGNLCLESDLIYRHKTYLRALPKPGDLVVFLNTAGYFMDFSASESIMQPVAKKVALSQRGSQFRWCADEKYWPLWETKTGEQ